MTPSASPAELQPVSYLKETPDVSGFIAIAADTFGLSAVSNESVRRFDSSGNPGGAEEAGRVRRTPARPNELLL